MKVLAVMMMFILVSTVFVFPQEDRNEIIDNRIPIDDAWNLLDTYTHSEINEGSVSIFAAFMLCIDIEPVLLLDNTPFYISKVFYDIETTKSFFSIDVTKKYKYMIIPRSFIFNNVVNISNLEKIEIYMNSKVKSRVQDELLRSIDDTRGLKTGFMLMSGLSLFVGLIGFGPLFDGHTNDALMIFGIGTSGVVVSNIAVFIANAVLKAQYDEVVSKLNN